MAAAAARKKTRYQSPGATYGSVAYDLAYADAAARPLERGGAEVLRPQPKARPRGRTAVRPKVQVREQGSVSVFAVVGFLAVGVFAALLMMSYVNLTLVSDEVVTLRSQLSALQTDEAKLLAQYERAFDLAAIEHQVTAGGGMVKPQSGQIIVLDMSEPDTVVRFQTEEENPEVGVLEEAKDVWSGFQSYFK